MTTRRVQAICQDDLEAKYFQSPGVSLYLTFTLTLPILLMAVLIVIIRATHKVIHKQLVKSSNNRNLAGLALTVIYIMIYVLCLDFSVLVISTTRHENQTLLKYPPTKTVNTFNYTVLVITAILNACVLLEFIVCLLYICCTELNSKSREHSDNHSDTTCTRCTSCCTSCCLENFLPCCIIPYFYGIFGHQTQSKYWKINSDDKDSDNKELRTKWVLTGLMVAPIFTIISHAGYILAAWFTEPSKTTELILVALGIILYFFFMFRHCYSVNEKFDGLCTVCTKKCTTEKCKCTSACDLITCKNKYCRIVCLVFFPMAFPISVLVSHCVDVITILSLYYRENCCCKCCKHDPDWSELELTTPLITTDTTNADTKDTAGSFNITAFCIAWSWGWMLAILPVLIIAAFYLVPLPTLKVTDYIQTIAQTVIVVIGLLLSYKVINNNESDLSRFLRGIRKSSTKDCDDDLEAAGNILMDAIKKRD